MFNNNSQESQLFVGRLPVDVQASDVMAFFQEQGFWPVDVQLLKRRVPDAPANARVIFPPNVNLSEILSKIGEAPTIAGKRAYLTEWRRNNFSRDENNDQYTPHTKGTHARSFENQQASNSTSSGGFDHGWGEPCTPRPTPVRPSSDVDFDHGWGDVVDDIKPNPQQVKQEALSKRRLSFQDLFTNPPKDSRSLPETRNLQESGWNGGGYRQQDSFEERNDSYAGKSNAYQGSRRNNSSHRQQYDFYDSSRIQQEERMQHSSFRQKSQSSERPFAQQKQGTDNFSHKGWSEDHQQLEQQKFQYSVAPAPVISQPPVPVPVMQPVPPQPIMPALQKFEPLMFDNTSQYVQVMATLLGILHQQSQVVHLNTAKISNLKANIAAKNGGKQ